MTNPANLIKLIDGLFIVSSIFQDHYIRMKKKANRSKGRDAKFQIYGEEAKMAELPHLHEEEYVH